MTAQTQPEALRLANRLDADATDADMGRKPVTNTRRKAAAELRRLHAELAQLREKRQPLSHEQKVVIERANTVGGYNGDYYDAFGIMEDVEEAHGIK